MAIVDHLAVVFPQARALQNVANVNTAYGLFIDGNINSAMTYAIGKF